MLMHIIYINTIHMLRNEWKCIYLGYDVNMANRIAKEAKKYYHVCYVTRINNDSIRSKVW